MTTKTVARSLTRNLRVRIAARGAERIAALASLLEGLGYRVAMDGEAADVVLADQERPGGADDPSVVLGGSEADAQGLLPETASPAEIDAALRAVAHGLIVRSPAARTAGFGAAQESAPRSLLTAREAQVLDAIADGLTNKAIARRLGISLHTVKFHVESVFRKLGARTRTEAVARARERRRQETIEL
ncbi:MAG TPA: response regulator transcription factor [Steroidobacteraceae bacterium]|nr:response regulator transcription factor [Steroidobacteraceae bacterium]